MPVGGFTGSQTLSPTLGIFTLNDPSGFWVAVVPAGVPGIFDFIKDNSATPDEKAEISELGKLIREAIATLPQKDRTIVEYRFYRNMQVKQIAAQVGLSSSRITRIVQSSLNCVREYLQKRGMTSY